LSPLENNSSQLFIILSKSPTQYKQKGISVAADAFTFCKGEIEKVELLGGGKAKFRRTSKGLLIDLPKDKTPNPISLVLKITNR
jgi:alpha-L-fucosidase